MEAGLSREAGLEAFGLNVIHLRREHLGQTGFQSAIISAHLLSTMSHMAAASSFRCWRLFLYKLLTQIL
jgi:hypothetical protein